MYFFFSNYIESLNGFIVIGDFQIVDENLIDDLIAKKTSALLLILPRDENNSTNNIDAATLQRWQQFESNLLQRYIPFTLYVSPWSSKTELLMSAALNDDTNHQLSVALNWREASQAEASPIEITNLHVKFLRFFGLEKMLCFSIVDFC